MPLCFDEWYDKYEDDIIDHFEGQEGPVTSWQLTTLYMQYASSFEESHA